MPAKCYNGLMPNFPKREGHGLDFTFMYVPKAVPVNGPIVLNLWDQWSQGHALLLTNQPTHPPYLCLNLLHLESLHPLLELVVVFQSNLLLPVQMARLAQILQCPVTLMMGKKKKLETWRNEAIRLAPGVSPSNQSCINRALLVGTRYHHVCR